MSAQRFVAANATDALRRIKAELGGDAVVLSSNDVADGVEIIAIAAADLADLPPPTASTSSPVRPAPMGAAPLPAPEHLGPPHGPATRRAVQTPSTPLRQSFEARVSQQAAQRPSLRDPVPSASITMPLASRGLPTAPVPMPMAPASTEPVRAATAPDPGLNVLSSQMVELKSLLSGHVAAGFWSSLQQTSPGHALLTRRLLNAGLSSQIVSQMLADLPVESDFDRLLDHAQQWVKQRLQVQDAFSMFDQGGVFAFIGPTGVGKTTTLAKIAARCVLRYGRRQVAVMTTDTYRIGAQEQLRVFARILNLPVVSLRDSDDMESKVADLSTRKIVLLDTAGVSQRDSMMVEQLELIRQGCSAVHRVLVMSATTSTRTLDDVIASHHQAIGGRGFDSSILTKIDEGMSLAPAIDCVLRHRLPMLFLSNGQRVPEDLFAADAAYIAHRTVNPRGGDETGVDPAHVPAMIADDINAWMAEARSP
jgi:flagellar biosynthesis protein FlhF